MKVLIKLFALTVCISGWLSDAAYAYEVAGNLPVIHITTENKAPIVDKEVYLPATYYVEGLESGFDDIGSVDEQLSLKIKGRGNYTWTGFDKKPYRLKLENKASLCGMKKSKHYVLLAHADDPYAYLRNEVGLNLSRRVGLAWTPSSYPVEVILNDKHIGLYFLTENIRVDEDRVNVVEQADLEEDDFNITGGWLVEIDNYENDPHVKIMEHNGNPIVFTYKSPEELSQKQKDYLTRQMNELNDAIYTKEKEDASKLLELLDIESAAKYYIVQEMMDDCESYHGSCYLYKDRGEDTKWHFGPVWDFGNSFARRDKNFIYVNPAFNQTWIGELAKFPVFQEKVESLWKDRVANQIEPVMNNIDQFINLISRASEINDKIWSEYAKDDLERRADDFKNLFTKSVKWLGKKWNQEPELPVDVYLLGTFNNWQPVLPFEYIGEGIYELRNITLSTEFKIADDHWGEIDYGIDPESNQVLTIDVPLKLKYRGRNIPSIEEEGVDVRFDLPNATLLIKKSGSSCAVTHLNRSIRIEGRHIISESPVNVYTVEGMCVAVGNDIELQRPGLYIIADKGDVRKVMVK